jgi:hypothetical protein
LDNHNTKDVTPPTTSATIIPRSLEQPNNSVKITNYLGNNIWNVLENLKLTTIDTPRDGHCLLHAVSLSYPTQLEETLTKELILNFIQVKAFKDQDKYSSFVVIAEPYTDAAYKYFGKKEYNNGFTDIIPQIICDALNITLIIINSNKRENIESTIITPNNEPTRNTLRTIHIHLENEHYSGLERTTSTPKTNTIIPSGISNVKSTMTIPTAMSKHIKPTAQTSTPYT